MASITIPQLPYLPAIGGQEQLEVVLNGTSYRINTIQIFNMTGGGTFPLSISVGGTGATTAAGARTNLGLGSIATQNANAVIISGGSIDGTIIGTTLPASGAFSSVSIASPLPASSGGTGLASLTSNGIMYGNGSSTLGVTAAGTTGQVLVGNTGGAPSWGAASGVAVTSLSFGATGLTPSSATAGVITVAGTLAAANGGTGRASLTSGAVLFGNGTSPVTMSVVSGDGTLASSGALVVTKTNGVSFGTAATVNTGTSAGNIPVLNGSGLIPSSLLQVPYTDISNVFLYSKTGSGSDVVIQANNTAATANTRSLFTLSTGTANSTASFYLSDGGGSPSTGIRSGTAVTQFNFSFDNVVFFSNAGVNLGNINSSGLGLKAGSLYYIGGSPLGYSNGLSGFGTAAAVNTGVASGNVPVLNGSGLLNATVGGTGQGSYAIGDILYADTTTTLAKLADVAGGNVLRSGGVGVAPSYGKVGLTTHVSGTLPIANGGTNITTYNTGDVLYGSASNVLSSLAIGSANQVLTVNGSSAPSWSSPAQGSVRQTVAQGPVDTGGLPTFLPASSVNLNLTSQNISTGINALVATASNGSNGVTGNVNAVGQATANLTWTGLTASTTNYLYVTISGGTLTTGFTTLQPIYQQGGTPATTNGQFTFNIGQMTGFMGNGSTAPQANIVFVGEAVTSGSAVTSTVAYAYNGVYDSGFTGSPATAAATVFTKNHNLGLKPIGIAPSGQVFVLENTVAEQNFSIGDRTNALNVSYAMSRSSIQAIVVSGATLQVTNKTTGAAATLTSADWQWKLVVSRGW